MTEDRKAFWRAFDISRFDGVVFDRPYVKALMLPEALFAPVRDTVLDILRLSFERQGELPTGAHDAAMFSVLNASRIVPLVRDLDLFCRLDLDLMRVVEWLGLRDKLPGMEFPANIRAAHGVAPPGYLDRPWATDHLHSDINAGAPADIFNFLIYIGGDLSTYAAFSDLDDALLDDLDLSHRPYAEVGEILGRAPRIDYTPQPGMLVMFDGCVPHQTVRGGGNPRISVDFRGRREDPYQDVGHSLWDDDFVPLSQYWTTGNPSTTFAERVDWEIAHLRESGADAALAARKHSADLLLQASMPK